jgi:hypothetical protein
MILFLLLPGPIAYWLEFAMADKNLVSRLLIAAVAGTPALLVVINEFTTSYTNQDLDTLFLAPLVGSAIYLFAVAFLNHNPNKVLTASKVGLYALCVIAGGVLMSVL